MNLPFSSAIPKKHVNKSRGLLFQLDSCRSLAASLSVERATCGSRASSHHNSSLKRALMSWLRWENTKQGRINPDVLPNPLWNLEMLCWVGVHRRLWYSIRHLAHTQKHETICRSEIKDRQASNVWSSAGFGRFGEKNEEITKLTTESFSHCHAGTIWKGPGRCWYFTLKKGTVPEMSLLLQLHKLKSGLILLPRVWGCQQATRESSAIRRSAFSVNTEKDKQIRHKMFSRYFKHLPFWHLRR